jgi:hypothetical protein
MDKHSRHWLQFNRGSDDHQHRSDFSRRRFAARRTLGPSPLIRQHGIETGNEGACPRMTTLDMPIPVSKEDDFINGR